MSEDIDATCGSPAKIAASGRQVAGAYYKFKQSDIAGTAVSQMTPATRFEFPEGHFHLPPTIQIALLINTLHVERSKRAQRAYRLIDRNQQAQGLDEDSAPTAIGFE